MFRERIRIADLTDLSEELGVKEPKGNAATVIEKLSLIFAGTPAFRECLSTLSTAISKSSKNLMYHGRKLSSVRNDLRLLLSQIVEVVATTRFMFQVILRSLTTKLE